MENSFQPLALAGLVARSTGFPVSIPGQGIKISFAPPLTAGLLRLEGAPLSATLAVSLWGIIVGSIIDI